MGHLFFFRDFLTICANQSIFNRTTKNEANMDEKEILELKKKIAASTPRPHPKKGEPGYDEFMRSIFKSAASNMLRDELENGSIR